MSQKWEYLTLTLNKNSSGVQFVQAVLPIGSVSIAQGQDVIDAMNELGHRGWELVTGYAFPGDAKPSLVFKRAVPEG